MKLLRRLVPVVSLALVAGLTTIPAANAIMNLYLLPDDGRGREGFQAGGGGGPPPLPVEEQNVTPQPPPIPATPDVLYYFIQQGQSVGPLTLEQISAQITAGVVRPSTLVWTAGLPDWSEAKDVGALAAALNTAPPDIPESEQYRLLIAGVWLMSETNAQGFTNTTQVNYSLNGTFNAVVTTTYQGMSSSMPVTGRWTIEAMGANQFSLSMTPDSGLPSTAVVRVIDQNTLYNETAGQQARRVG